MIENPYFDLHRGKEVRRSVVEAMSPMTAPALDILMRDNKIVGQHTLDGDIVLWMPSKTDFSGVLPPKAQVLTEVSPSVNISELVSNNRS